MPRVVQLPAETVGQARGFNRVEACLDRRIASSVKFYRQTHRVKPAYRLVQCALGDQHNLARCFRIPASARAV